VDGQEQRGEGNIDRLREEVQAALRQEKAAEAKGNAAAFVRRRYAR